MKVNSETKIVIVYQIIIISDSYPFLTIQSGLSPAKIQCQLKYEKNLNQNTIKMEKKSKFAIVAFYGRFVEQKSQCDLLVPVCKA